MIYVPTIKITFCRSYIRDANTPNEKYIIEKTGKTKLIRSYDGLQKYIDVKNLMERLGHIVELVELERYYEHTDEFVYDSFPCEACYGTGLVEGEHFDDLQSCLNCNGRGEYQQNFK